MTALETMHVELNKLTNEANKCLSDYGYVLPEYRYEYQQIVTKLVLVRDCILYLEELKNNRVFLSNKRMN